MPISNLNFREMDSAYQFSNSKSEIRTVIDVVEAPLCCIVLKRLGQPMIFGFDTIQSMGTSIKLSTTTSSFFWSLQKVGGLS